MIDSDKMHACVSEPGSGTSGTAGESDDESSSEFNDNADSSSEDDSLRQKQTIPPINVGDYAVVEYDGEMFPGIVEIVKKSGAEVSVMARSGRQNWKWPMPKDQIFYHKEQIINVITRPREIGSRGVFKVDEMSAYD